VRRCRAIAVIAAALVPCPPAAAASLSDAASTHAFLSAWGRDLRTTVDRQHQEAAAVDAVIENVESTCAHVIPSGLGSAGTAAQKRSVRTFAYAAQGELVLALIHPLRSPYLTFTRRIVHLRWSNPALNRETATAVRRVRALVALRTPDLCRQAALAQRANFNRTPPAIRAFVKRYVALTSAASPSTDDLLTLMKPLADRRDLDLLGRVRRLERRVSGIDSHLVSRAGPRLGDALFG
jgi:hypothetical protein